MDLGRAAAARLDGADPLAAFVDEFVTTEPDLIYFDGNSLGRLPRRTVKALDHVVGDGWGTRPRPGVGGVDGPAQRVGDRIGRAALEPRPAR